MAFPVLFILPSFLLTLLPLKAHTQGTEPPPLIRSGIAQNARVKVTQFNGFVTIQLTDLSLMSAGGATSWRELLGHCRPTDMTDFWSDATPVDGCSAGDRSPSH
jgi:hypothetical protein